jgi:hypothetical protein
VRAIGTSALKIYGSISSDLTGVPEVAGALEKHGYDAVVMAFGPGATVWTIMLRASDSQVRGCR